MSNLNWYFYKVWLPIQVLTLGLLFYVDSINWWLVLIGWFLIGPLGTGVGLHRLFAHRSFNTSKPIEYFLAYLGTISAYSPILYWVSQHQYHHKHSDKDIDPTSIKHKGFWYSFLYWRFLNINADKTLVLHYCSKRIIKDKFLMFCNNHFTKIIYVHIVILFLFDPSILLSLLLLPIVIESNRLNLLNSVAHVKHFPLNYRNYNSPDESYNNLLIGYLSLGFGWHNNHHHNPTKLVIHDKWWEIDIEGYLGKLLSKT